MALATPFPASVHASRAQSRPASPGRVRLTRRGKAVVTLGISLLGFALLQGSGALEATASAVAGEPATALVVVAPGENLWSIAERVAPDTDPRSTILAIRELNGIPAGAVLAPGQGIVVPR